MLRTIDGRVTEVDPRDGTTRPGEPRDVCASDELPLQPGEVLHTIGRWR